MVSNPFDCLPIETNQHIASFLTSDFDLCHFRRISHSTHNAVDADNNSFWRRRFLATFEKPMWSESSNVKYKREYQKRRRALMYGAKYEAALTRREPREIRKSTEALEVIRDLIQDSFSEKKETNVDSTVYESANMQAVLHFVDNHDLLHFVLLAERMPIPTQKRTTRASMNIVCLPKRLLQTIQVLLAPAMFDLDRNLNHFSFSETQQAVYGTAAEHPIFNGCHNLDVNMQWVLHHINFWKYHMMRQAECTLHEPFTKLAADEKPRFWSSQLQQGSSNTNTLGTHWKGSYAYVDRAVISQIRNGRGEKEPIADEFNGDVDAGAGSFQDLRLELVDEADASWPPTFEQHLKSLTAPPSRAKTRAQQRSATPDGLAAFKPQSFQFVGEGHDVAEEFCAQGWLNALPVQQGVPGWQRMTMMKYFEDGETGEVDGEALWAYEGIVLPGGQIMLGRWWSPGDGTGSSQYSGPFILWCVDGPRYADSEAGGQN